MGITSNDIAAQRAMLERGEEKRKADWKQAERERLRDTFAAAALTGLLADQSLGELGDTTLATRAYELASAMIEERVKWSQLYTLTDKEREAVDNMIHLIETQHDDYGKEAHRLRNLLDRLK
jgi:hypothetical protein